MSHWFRDIRLRRRANGVFLPPLLREKPLAESRFREALDKARGAYLRMRNASPPPEGLVHSQWEKNIREVESYFLDGFDMQFLRHSRIDGTMVFTNRSAHDAEWPFLEAWRPADTLRRYLAEGLNERFLEGKLLSSSLINSAHHLYHLARFETFRGEPIEGVRSVVEFGGGYGNLARLFRNFGNLSEYTIIDLPLFSCIQYVFLATVFGPDDLRLVEGPETTGGVIRLLPVPFLNDAVPAGDLFVSTWALSESPAEAYENVRRKDWFGAREILLAFHDGWKPWGMEELIAALRGGFRRVATDPIPFLPGSHYLLATGKTASG